MAKEGGRDELNFTVRTTKYLEDATNDTRHYLLQKMEKLDESKMGEPMKVAEGTMLGLFFFLKVVLRKIDG